jgi:hypothetical protein
MPSKGSIQMNTTDQRSLSNQQHHQPQSQGLADVNGEHGTTELGQEIGNSFYYFSWACTLLQSLSFTLLLKLKT